MFMANEGHVALLKRGVNAWNAWRDKNPEVRPNLSGADLFGANLNSADLRGANLNGANLHAANLSTATLVQADLTNADLTGSRIYGVCAWGLKLEGTQQRDLVITARNEPKLTVDNIEVAQFIYLLLHNE